MRLSGHFNSKSKIKNVNTSSRLHTTESYSVILGNLNN